MYIVLLFDGERLVRVEEFKNYTQMAKFILEYGEFYRCEVIPV
jgi:hypothetical protein